MTSTAPTSSDAARRTGWLKIAAITIAVVALIDVIAVAAYLSWCDNIVSDASSTTGHQTETTAAHPFDSGILFFDGFENGNQLDLESRQRTDHAAKLLATATIPHLIIVGGRRHNPERFGAVLMAERLFRHGVVNEQVTADRLSFDTLTNWQQAVTLMQQHGYSQPLLISGTVHLARIRTIASQPFQIALSPAQSAWQRAYQRPFFSWVRVHREWLAWAAMALLDRETHYALVERWRNFWD